MPTPPNARPRLYRPAVEILEDRWLPTAYFVSNLNDAGLGSLRQAVLDADAHPGVGGDTIAFDPGVTGVITLTSGPLTLSDNVSILGPGAGLLFISGNNASRVLTVTQGTTASVQGLTITDGNASAGGGIDNAGTLTLNQCTLSDNQANPITKNLNVNLPTGGGGAILNEVGATLTLQSCTLADNVANALNDSYDVFGGGLLNEGVAAVSACNFTDNQALGGGGPSFFGASCGGAIDNFGGATLTASGSSFDDNQAIGMGGGNWGIGGAIENNAGFQQTAPSTASISNSTFTGNVCGVGAGVEGNGGALDNEGTGATMTVTNCRITGNYSTGGTGNSAIGGGIMNYYESIFYLIDSTVSGNVANGPLDSCQDGGGIYNLTATMTIDSSTIDDNTAVGGAEGGNPQIQGYEALGGQGLGGGISNNGGGTLTIYASTISGNQALGGPDAYVTGTDGHPVLGIDDLHTAQPYVIDGGGLGGGLCNSNGSTLTLIDSVVSGNLAQGGAPSATAGGSPAIGGGIENLKDSTVFVIDSTITGNRAVAGSGADGGGDAEGGGLDSSYDSTATIEYSNITGNFAVGGAGGVGPHGKDLGDNLAAGFYSIVGVLANDDSGFTIVLAPSLATLSASLVDVGRPAAANGSAPTPISTVAPTSAPPLLAVLGFQVLGGPTPAPNSAQGATEIDPLPAWLADQPERLNLPTERDILAGMNVVGSLLARAQPQANLVPQPQDVVAAVGALVPSDSPRGSLPQKERRGDKPNARLYAVNLLEHTLLGPPAPRDRRPESAVLDPGPESPADPTPVGAPEPSVEGTERSGARGDVGFAADWPVPMLLALVGSRLWRPRSKNSEHGEGDEQELRSPSRPS